MSKPRNQAGFGYFIVILIGALVLGVVVFAGYRVMGVQDDQESSQTVPTSASQSNIEDSEDLQTTQNSVDQTNVEDDLDTSEVDQDVDALL